VVARTTAVLGRRRSVAFAGLTAALAAYTATAGHLWDSPGLWPDVLFVSLVLFPATFGLIWLLLPVAFKPRLLPVGLGLVALAVVSRFAELDVLFNLTKLFALALLGFWFLSYFENVAWAALVAAIIPWVDALSVWRGPTNKGLKDFPELVDDVSIAFPLPGGHLASLGPPDILFFALFLASAARFGLRIAWTWIGMTALLAVTFILTATTDVIALPALPAICLGFLLPNADLLWHALRRRGRAPIHIYGRAGTYDLEADVIERRPGKIVLLTRDRPPLTGTIVPVGSDHPFAADQKDAAGKEILSRLTIGDADAGEFLVHDLPNGLVVVLHDESPTVLDNLHPEQLAADEAKVERLRRERS
jgi:hypothetical protein